MPVKLICGHCGKAYQRPPSVADHSKFCSATCAKAHRQREYRDLICERCGKTFNACQDHGVWPRFCCRSCFTAGAVKPKQKTCPVCKKEFLAVSCGRRTEDGLKIYCSQKCAWEGMKKSEIRKCLHCGKEYYAKPGPQLDRGEGCCSVECKNAYYIDEKSHSYKGGGFISQITGEKFVARPGYSRAKNYIGEHRMIASAHIGRMLTRDEYVIRLNQEPTDNRPENLFICKTNRDFCAMRDGKVKWPTKSNLDEYK